MFSEETEKQIEKSGNNYTYPPGEFRKSVEPGEPLAPGEPLPLCPCDKQSLEECHLCRDTDSAVQWERQYHKVHGLVMVQAGTIHRLELENAELMAIIKTGNGGKHGNKRR